MIFTRLKFLGVSSIFLFKNYIGLDNNNRFEPAFQLLLDLWQRVGSEANLINIREF